MEPGTLLLRLVNSQEFNDSVNTLLVWFTDCDNFSNLNNSNFEICVAGVGTRRLYYDDDNRYTTQNCYSSFTVIQLHTCCNLGKKIIFVVIVRKYTDVYLVHVIRTTNTNLKFFQRIFVYLLCY